MSLVSRLHKHTKTSITMPSATKRLSQRVNTFTTEARPSSILISYSQLTENRIGPNDDPFLTPSVLVPFGRPRARFRGTPGYLSTRLANAATQELAA
ncbi:hypothetical protein FOPG_19218 [Fusarium oxysporum f. sp. conglutinans race 2 54008]|uniref:Uncharacterized protein n=1 Tax=Fusarium oxysporum f. sp. conglutinans race 2 54008 TaxID=1089457 RepID=X0GMK1_FUSOX|nr:hypothetical protein FOPG_19218 [Fusarium oxysporum f. sp. conglutinans race 2 54008]